jgi:aminoglycoside phosphotransferase (APT) family kinase protein
VVGPELAQELIAAQFPQLGGLEVRPFGAGFDNTAFLLGGEWVFRFPRRQIAVPLMERECRVLPKVAARLPLPIPDPRYVGAPTAKYEWPFGGYRLVPGQTADQFALSDEERAGLAGSLGRFFHALHAVSADEAAAFGVGPDTIGKLDVPLRIRRTHEGLQTLRGAVVSAELEKKMVEVLEAQSAAPPPRGPHVLLHGDVYSRHLLLDETRQLAGVIDWGDIMYGHRATDLGGVLTFLPATARDAFFSAYGEIDAATMQLSRFRAVTHHVWVGRYAHEQKDAALLRESIGGLERATS